METEQYLRVMKALADESRHNIINMLLKRDYCVGGLAKHLKISEAAVSQHLQVLRKAELITGEKRGYFTYYGVNRRLLQQLAERINEIACQSPLEDCGCARHREKNCLNCDPDETKVVS